MKNKLYTILDVIKLSTDFLSKKGVPNSKCDAEWIISNTINLKRVELYLNYENIVSQDDLDSIRKDIVKRSKRIPLQHILGKVNFAGNEIICDSRALVPRNETEQLTEIIQKELSSNFTGKILDLGVGSGVILITLCKAFPQSRGFGFDKSDRAISLAIENIELNKLTNVELKTFDWEKEVLNEKFDLIISNPPYLSQDEWKDSEPEVKDYDPKIALVANDDGLADLKKIITISQNHLVKNGLLALEIGHNQDKELIKVLEPSFREIKNIKDYGGKNRFLVAKK